MAQSNIHKMIEKYYDATLREQEETLLRQMLSQTDLDTEDVREAKATMGLFSTNRKITGKKLSGQKPSTLWGKMKYAAVFAIGLLFDALLDFDDPIDNKFSK